MESNVTTGADLRRFCFVTAFSIII